jgi:hypothetical protein
MVDPFAVQKGAVLATGIDDINVTIISYPDHGVRERH